MTIKLHQSKVRTIRQGDPLFTIEDGFVRYQRAGIHVLPECPPEYATIIHEAVRVGWLKPVAYMVDHEVTFETLQRDFNGTASD